ncbi:hypothetical protein FALBO_14025 [Fusarium albosuccineum]|uniref:Uncharacterized protein n=1 Tax=Fusarium albosuccineum TaxID=1237068 RepID=A0A8H4L164_9HYPO|nr:hypothetical protein FALBO_14025 [Fusarium albosuccineum]
MASSAANNVPWVISSPHNNTADLQNLIAPPWTDTPNFRGTLDILQSCILTLVACIYTALHLDVPTKTSAGKVLLYKLKWVTITLLAPEIAIYMAADQLQQAWSLKSKLRAMQTARPGDDDYFHIDLRYAFFIVMGGVRVNIEDILSFPDLHYEALKHFKCRPYAVRLNPKTVILLANRGHWIPISDKKIDDKSKADPFQKALVLIQVMWMVMQCVKPLNVQDPEIIRPTGFEGEIALLVQQQFYPNMSTRLALFPPQGDTNQPPPRRFSPLMTTDWVTPEPGSKEWSLLKPEERYWPEGVTMRQTSYQQSLPLMDRSSQNRTWAESNLARWVKPEPRMQMWPGNILPSGLLYHCEMRDIPLLLTPQFLRRWDAIFRTFPFKNRDKLASTSNFIKVNTVAWDYRLVDPREREGISGGQDLFLARLQEFRPSQEAAFRNLAFSEGKRNLDIDVSVFTESAGSAFGLLGFFKEFPWLAILALALTGLYGGVHLTAWNWIFPTLIEEWLWKGSCLYIAGLLPIYFVLGPLLATIASSAVKEGITWGYIIVESFISLRHVPVGVFASPTWLPLIRAPGRAIAGMKTTMDCHPFLQGTTCVAIRRGQHHPAR